MVSRIGKYTVEKELGQGGFGKVFLAFDPDVGQPVAIKQLRVGGDPDLLKRFHLEIRTTASLRHKNIVTIYACGEEAGDPYLVMEFLEGATLKQVILERRPLSLLDKVRIMTQVAEGLAYAHSKGVVHRDVKPENIMLLPDDNVKIMDFGIALGPDRKTDITQTGGIIGTPPYFAPEQLEGYKANELTDIFSFGDVYYELLTGMHPFEQYKNEWKSLQIAIMSYEPRSIAELVPGCPDALESLVHRALAKQKEFRYQSFEEVHLDSEAILVDLKHEAAAAILHEVAQLLDSENLQSALTKIRLAYQLEPGNREVRRLREEINLRLQKSQVQGRVAELLADAEKHIVERRYAEAVQSLEMGARLDSTNVVVIARLDEARAQLERYLRANSLVSEARFHQQKGLLAEAQERLQEALLIDPDHTDAGRLSQRVHDELERRRADERRQQAIRAAREHLASKRFAEALAVLAKLEEEIPGASGAAELRSEIQYEQAEETRRVRAEQFKLALARTREAMQAGDLERAGVMVEHLLANFASEQGAAEIVPVLRDGLASLMRARDIGQYRQTAQDLLQEKSFDKALDLLAEALRKFPDDTGIQRLNQSAVDLRRAHQRSEAIAAALKEATAKRGAGDLHGARDLILKARQDLGDDVALLELTHQLEAEIERQRYGAGLRSLLQQSRGLMEARQYSEAISRLEKEAEFAGEAEVRALLESARSAAAAEKERSFVEEILVASGKLQAEKAWSKALAAVERGLARYPHNTSLTDTAERLRGAVKSERRRSRIDIHRGAIRLEIESRRWRAAEAALNRARAEFPAEGAFDELASQVERGRYEDGWREFEARVNQNLAVNALAQAQQNLDDQATRTIYAHDPRWKNLADEVAKRRDYEETLLEADRQRGMGRYSDAEKLLTEVIDQGSPDKRAQQMRGAIQVQRLEAARQQEIARIAVQIREQMGRDDLARAASDLATARSRYPGEAVWSELQSDLDARQLAVRRQAQIAAAEENVRRALRGDDIRQSVAALTDARAKFPGEAVWAALQTEIDARQAVLRRQQEIAQTAAAIRELLQNEDISRAASDLAAARSRYPAETVWTEVQADLDARRRAVQHNAQVAAAEESVRQALRRNDIRQSVAALKDARAKFPGETAWAGLETEINARQAVLNRRDNVAVAAEGIRDRLRHDDLDGAKTALDTARRTYPHEEIWPVLQNEIQALERSRVQPDTPAGAIEEPRVEPAAPPAIERPEVPAGALRPLPWKPIGAVAVLVIAVVLVVVVHKTPPPPEKHEGVVAFPVEIRTDPPGASVQVGNVSCTTPNCRLDLQPGTYQVEAHLKDYEPKSQTVVVNSSNLLVDLTLQPLPPPPPPPGSGSTTTGTLVVEASVQDALVSVDGKPPVRMQSGTVTLPLEPRSHQVRVERNGYEPAVRQINITAGRQKTVSILLIPQNAKLELSGAPAGIELRIDGKTLGRTDGSGVYPLPTTINPGEHSVEVAQGLLGQGSGSHSVTQRFENGQTVRLAWKPDAPPPIDNSSTGGRKAAPTPEEIEQHDWEKIRDTSDPAQVREFRKNHPNGAHAKEAETLLDRLAWANNKKDEQSLQDYLREFSNGAHAAEAKSRLQSYEDAVWKAVDQTKLDQLRRFIDENPGNPHIGEAKTRLDGISSKQKTLREQVRDAVNRLNDALQHKKQSEVKDVWPGKSNQIILEDIKAQLKVSLTPLEEPVLQDDANATVRCSLNTSDQRAKPTPPQKAILQLHYSGGRWYISDLKVVE